MLFNSFIFIFLFLPISVIVFYLIKKSNYQNLAIIWLIVISLFFYGWWNIKYLALILFSIVLNYSFGLVLKKHNKKIYLILGIFINLFIIGYFKYSNFFLENMNFFFKNQFILNQIILPLGISFFTFQQITYLVDTYNGENHDRSFTNYFLFVIFFPQLIAGPIVHHSKMIPQFNDKKFGSLKFNNISIGLTVFTLGLFKKVFLADNLAIYANPAFDAAEVGFGMTFFDAWGGALAYTLQLYFDFSGYSDMAIGIGLMFGIAIPINFLSPFKAKNISEFWRLWHISLSRFIRDYLYYPISLSLTRFSYSMNLNPIGVFFLSIILPTMISFFLVGLWHGAGWQFIIFGLIHGSYIVIHNFWLKIKVYLFKNDSRSNFFTDLFSQLLTFISVIFSFVFFRSSSLDAAINYVNSMIDYKAIDLSDIFEITTFGTMPFTGVYLLTLSMFIVILLPNVHEFIIKNNNTFRKNYNEITLEDKLSIKKITWKPSFFWGVFISIILTLSIMSVSGTNEFLYFQF